MGEDLQTAVLKQLRTGKSNALTGKLLKSRLGLRDTRQIRLAMIELIEKGTPIVFSAKGYFIAESFEECMEARKRLRSYGLMIFRHYKYLRKAAEKHFSGQMAMKL